MTNIHKILIINILPHHTKILFYMKYLLPLFFLSLFFSCAETEKSDTTTSTMTDNTESNMKEQYLFVGTYTKKEGHVDGKGEGIYRLAFSEKNDSIYFDFTKSVFFKTINPSYLTISKNKKYLYAVNELNPNDGDSGTVEAYKVGGIVKVFPLLGSGTFGPETIKMEFKGKGVTERQEGSHPHSTTLSPDNKYLYVADLGTDKISGLKINYETGEVLPTEQGKIKMQAGAGPRHFDFHPNGKIGYVVNELDATINVFDYDATTGSLTQKQSLSTLPEGFSEFSLCADIHVHPSGKFVYASNRGHNSIAIFGVDEKTGILTFLKTESTKGDFPRSFAIDPSGNFLWVANQNSDSIFIFKINTQTGELKEVGNVEIPTPVCLKFL